jgi:hypothetical protein
MQSQSSQPLELVLWLILVADYAIANQLTPFISMQNHYNMVYREEEREMFPTLKVCRSCHLSNDTVESTCGICWTVLRGRVYPMVTPCTRYSHSSPQRTDKASLNRSVRACCLFFIVRSCSCSCKGTSRITLRSRRRGQSLLGERNIMLVRQTNTTRPSVSKRWLIKEASVWLRLALLGFSPRRVRTATAR